MASFRELIIRMSKLDMKINDVQEELCKKMEDKLGDGWGLLSKRVMVSV